MKDKKVRQTKRILNFWVLSGIKVDMIKVSKNFMKV